MFNRKFKRALDSRRVGILHTFVKAQEELDLLIADEESYAKEIAGQIADLESEKAMLAENTAKNRRILKKFDDFLDPQD